MHKSESFHDNEMHKILWDFEIQADHLILARRTDLVLIKRKKKNLLACQFYQKDRQILEPFQRTKKK